MILSLATVDGKLKKITAEVGDLFGGEAAAGLPRDVLRADGGEKRLRLQGGEVALALTGDEL